MLSSILDSAVEFGYAQENPARGVKFPPQAPSIEPVHLTGDALTRLLAELGEPYKAMVSLTALTGLRVGELLALRWQSVNMATGTLQVRESVFQSHFQKPKSAKGERTIPLGGIAIGLLERQRRRSVKLEQDSLIFPNQRGGPYRASNLLERILRPAGEAAGVGRVTWHQLRHVHATVLHNLGVPAKIAQKQLGHARVETTLNIYTHAIPEAHREAVENLERQLFPTVPKLGQVKQSGETVLQ